MVKGRTIEELTANYSNAAVRVESGSGGGGTQRAVIQAASYKTLRNILIDIKAVLWIRDPQGSEIFCRIRIRNPRGFGSGSETGLKSY
jgi:hypothetical protein